MRIPTVRGIIDRRILVNFRVDPHAISKVLPAPFLPQLVDGHAIAGICLIRLVQIRPRMLPRFMGIASENAAHRIAVQWPRAGNDDAAKSNKNPGHHSEANSADMNTGVYIPRRDTSSRLNALVGGRIFPGVHHFAKFDVEETDQRYQVAMSANDGSASLAVDATVAEQIPKISIFNSVEHVSEFFEQGSLGYSPRSAVDNNEFDGLELRTFNWDVTPLEVTRVESSFFDDLDSFPAGTVEFDNALLMRGIDHEWHGRETICCG